MTFTIEPMINEGTPEIDFLEDGWTVATADGKLSAQYEYTIAVTAEGCEILTPWYEYFAGQRQKPEGRP
jgi:methionyl aminopeptidase